MPQVPQRPNGPMLRIPEPTDTPRPFWSPGSFNGPAVEEVVKKIRKARPPKSTPVKKVRKAKSKPVKERKPKVPRQPRARTVYNPCSWCGDSCALPAKIHPRCAEAKERIASQK